MLNFTGGDNINPGNVENNNYFACLKNLKHSARNQMEKNQFNNNYYYFNLRGGGEIKFHQIV